MNRLRSLLSDPRILSLIGIAAVVAFLFLAADTLQVALLWAGLASLAIVLAWLGIWWVRRRRAQASAASLGAMLEQSGESAGKATGGEARAEIAALQTRMQAAVKTIKTSKLGQLSGAAALYELPWYITIGNPAAGKSTAIVNSGLKFPFEDGGSAVIKGIGGTRNCDWFFTTEGILLDTAGRYSVHEEDRSEWLGFLGLLKKHRTRAPINGIIVTVSIAELMAGTPSFAIHLAKNLRQRVQELTEKLEVFAPVYVLFTKADLIPGFHEFFSDLDWNERNRVWGSTLPYDPAGQGDAIAEFNARFDELYEGLRALSVAQMARCQGDQVPPGLLTFPSEFAAVKPSLRAFLATLFEENPFQFKPIFRGFYITSALQSGDKCAFSDERISHRFGLSGPGPAAGRMSTSQGFFLKEMFSKVIFADRNLVRQYASRGKIRLRQGALLGLLAAFGLALGGWSWSLVNNRELTANVARDLEQAARIQDGRLDLQSRLEALGILQTRLAQIERFNAEHPLSLGLGLYQGDQLADTLRREYFAGVKDIMLKPVRESIEVFLSEVNAQQSLAPAPADQTQAPAQAGPYQAATPGDVEDAYNALKTYLMLASHEHVEVGHLSDQITRFWRGWLEANRGTMSREQMIGAAERILTFHLEHANAADWPTIDNNLAIVDQTRDKLRRVVRGMPAAERVYAEIKARAATRFPSMTVASIVGPDNVTAVSGSQIVSGAFTEAAWREYVQGAIKDAATNAQSGTDWVLKTAMKDDLTLEGSPEQIQKSLIALYKKDYAAEWKRFAQGISVAGFATFPQAVAAMNRIGDPQSSPVGILLKTLFEQTAWDNPSVAAAGLDRAKQGFVAWFKRSILGMTPSRVQVDINIQGGAAGGGGAAAMGTIGREFSGLVRIMAARDGAQPLSATYLAQLSRIRTRLNQIHNQGDPGPGAVKLMRATLEGGESELAEALRFVDEQMLTGMPDEQRAVLRPLLLRPLQQSFAAIVRPAEQELNRTWNAQIYETFNRTLALKYPFAPQGNIEASPTEIAQVFGPEGAIARYVQTALGSLVVRRGDTVSPSTWGDLGVTLRPEFMAGFAQWVAPLGGAAGGGPSQPQTVFMLRPAPAPGTTGYTIEIDGQRLDYRNGAQQWANFVWPNASGVPGARIAATTYDGRTLEILNQPGRYGLEKMINAAQRSRRGDGTFHLAWSSQGVGVAVELRIISSPQAQAGSAGQQANRGLGGVVLPAEIAGGPPVPIVPAEATLPATPAPAVPAAQPGTAQAATATGGLR